jgi:hypothetical protein
MQAQAQLAAAASAQVAASQERKELASRLDRLGVEQDRAARERDSLDLRLAALQQQYRLLQAVVAREEPLQPQLGLKGAAVADRLVGAGSKENGAAFAIKARRAGRAGKAGVLVPASPSFSD